MNRSGQELRAIRKELLQLRARQHRLSLRRAGQELSEPLRLIDDWFAPSDPAAGPYAGVLKLLLTRFRSPLIKGMLGLLLAYFRLRKKKGHQEA